MRRRHEQPAKSARRVAGTKTLQHARAEEIENQEIHRRTIQAKMSMYRKNDKQDTNTGMQHSFSGGAVGWMVGQTAKCPGIDPQGQMA